jgi:hypothetical protein
MTANKDDQKKEAPGRRPADAPGARDEEEADTVQRVPAKKPSCQSRGRDPARDPGAKT